jgi:hypothetical protein
MQRQKMSQILGDDRTLNSDELGKWQIAAMESGMPPSEVEAVTVVRRRFLGAGAIVDEVLGDRLTAEAVTEAARQIHAVAEMTAPLNLYWQDKPIDAPQALRQRRRSDKQQ